MKDFMLKIVGIVIIVLDLSRPRHVRDMSVSSLVCELPATCQRNARKMSKSLSENLL